MKIKLFKVNKYSAKTIMLIIMLIPFIQARTYSEMPEMIGKIYQWAAIFSTSCVFLQIIKSRFRGLTFSREGIFLLFWLFYFWSTLLFMLNGLSYVARQAYTYMGLVLLISRSLKQSPKRLLFSLTFIYESLTLLNFLLMFLYPNGLYKVSSYHTAHLLGDDNAIAYIVLPGVVCVVAYSYYLYGKMKLFALIDIIVAELTFFRVWTVSAMVCCTLLIIFLVLIDKNIDFPPYIYLVAFILSVLLILFGTSVPFISNFITTTLQKDVSFGGRIYLWASALEMISKSPFLGYGGFFHNGRWVAGSWGISYPCHTPYLQMLIDGGICLFSVFLAITIKAFASLNKFKSDKVAQVFSVGLFCIMLNYVFEFSAFHHIFILFELAIGYKCIQTSAAYS